jgi:ABC-type phosphate/phosphonate transport system substrate-binding protein
VIATPAAYQSVTPRAPCSPQRRSAAAHTAPTSNSGYKAPSVLLKTDFNLEAEKDYTPTFSGKHDNSIMGVVNKDYDAAPIASTVSMTASRTGPGSASRSCRARSGSADGLSAAGRLDCQMSPKAAGWVSSAVPGTLWVRRRSRAHVLLYELLAIGYRLIAISLHTTYALRL